jgi:hypothetical protein
MKRKEVERLLAGLIAELPDRQTVLERQQSVQSQIQEKSAWLDRLYGEFRTVHNEANASQREICRLRQLKGTRNNMSKTKARAERQRLVGKKSPSIALDEAIKKQKELDRQKAEIVQAQNNVGNEVKALRAELREIKAAEKAVAPKRRLVKLYETYLVMFDKPRTFGIPWPYRNSAEIEIFGGFIHIYFGRRKGFNKNHDGHGHYIFYYNDAGNYRSQPPRRPPTNYIPWIISKVYDFLFWRPKPKV